MRAALGKGLADLIGDQSGASVEQMPIDNVVANRSQPRGTFDPLAINDLAGSIKQFGILQPIIVRPISEGKFEIIAGERRYRAAIEAGLTAVPVIIRPTTHSDSLVLALIENLQRENITPLESARAYQRLSAEHGYSQDEIAARVGKARTTVSNTIRLLKLPSEILEGLDSGLISEGHARALLAIRSPAAQIAGYRRILSKDLSVRDTEQMAKPTPEAGKARQRKVDPDVGALEERISEYLGAPVRITGGLKSGAVAIRFFSPDDLERIVELIGS